MPIDRSQLRRMIDSMERAMTRMECDQKARHDVTDILDIADYKMDIFSQYGPLLRLSN
jgi:hypothetical protein